VELAQTSSTRLKLGTRVHDAQRSGRSAQFCGAGQRSCSIEIIDSLRGSATMRLRHHSNRLSGPPLPDVAGIRILRISEDAESKSLKNLS
jgi:hypothetical protein